MKENRSRFLPPQASSAVVLGVLLLCLACCLPRHRVADDRRASPSGKIETRGEPRRDRRPPLSKMETGQVERRETRGVQYGIASWYGPDFHGRPTSSGEIYDMHQLTCAHNTLALGTAVIVTNLENGRSLELRVNDRGPFAKERIIDLSYSAARILGIWEKGTAFVKVETVGPWTEETPRITLQVGSFSEEVRARLVAEQLRKGFDNVHVTPVETSVQTYYRVRIGPFETRESAQRTAEQLSRMGYQVLLTSR